MGLGLNPIESASASLAAPSAVENGPTTRIAERMVGARIAAARSGPARAIRFGRSSPKTSMAALSPSVAATIPIVSAHGAAAGHLENHEEKRSAADATMTTAAMTVLRVSQNWTSARNRPGCSAIARAASAP